jgi:DNA helicase II / ATP-dependent DNA helicase PcrA
MDQAALTPQQRQAVTHRGSPLMVLAGPGTGKTRTLTHRLAYLVQEQGIPPKNILAVTFTNQAAEEMRARVAQLLPRDSGAAPPRITTFHGFSYRLLRQSIFPGHRLLSENESLEVLSRSLRDRQQKLPTKLVRELSRRISLAKGSLQWPEARDRLPEWSLYPKWPDLYQEYQQRLADQLCWDFDDLITQTVCFLENQAEFRERIWREFPWVFVDEFQDINAAQYRLFRLMAGPNRDWMVIGDPNQAIYGFRGARADFFRQLREEAEPVKEIVLEDTFRLNRTILEAAQQVLAASPASFPIRLTTIKNGPPTLPVAALPSAEEEARQVVRIIETEMGGISMLSMGSPGDGDASRSFSDFAVLYRLHAQGEMIGRFLDEKGIPYQRVRETHWADCPEVRQIFSRMKALVPFPGTPLQALDQVLKDAGSLPEASYPEPLSVIRTIEIEALKQLRLSAAAHSGDLESFLETLSLKTGLDTYQPDRETVKLLTLHAAKGLEFPVVILTGCEAGLLPLTLFGETDLEEERRLFYVGCTRATEKLFFTWAQKRTLMGQSLQQRLSPFVADIDEKILSRIQPDTPKKTGLRKNRQMSLFN